MTVDLNCDTGEGIGNDAAIMPFISSANIACGFHAGDEQTMNDTVLLALKYNVNIGAHPSYPDRENFGRKTKSLDANEIYEITFKQIETLQAIALKHGSSLHHVKPHGALYNAAAVSKEISDVIVKAVHDFDSKLIFFGLANSEMIKSAQRIGSQYKQEVFADRTYQPNGTLTPRTQPNALIETKQESIAQVLQMIKSKTVMAVDGSVIPIQADTICIHGDGKHAVEFAQALHAKLKAEEIQIAAS